ncbi:hypothetical protein ACFFRE_02615, partial [Aciditerrimonas ferrireducens]
MVARDRPSGSEPVAAVSGSGAQRAGWGDPRLRARVASVRGPLAVAVAAGLGQTACLVAQAVLLGDLVAQAFRAP